MTRFKQRDMQVFMMDYDLPSADSDVRLRFGMHIVDDEGAKSDQFSMSVVAKPTTTIALNISRIQLFVSTMKKPFKHPYLTRAGQEKDRECGKVRRRWVYTTN